MSTLLDNIKESRSMNDVKSALAEIGVDISNINDLEDVASAIRKCNSGPQVVVNAALTAGKGIKVTPIDRKGYKISANSDAVLTQDICRGLQAGTTVQKALAHIIHDEIPHAMKEAIQAPAIVDIEIFKAEPDGVDYYDNKAFGRKGQGRKTGLRPFNWYMKIYTPGQCEPIYIDLGVFVAGLRDEFLHAAAHQTERIVNDILNGKKPGHHHPHRPPHKHPEIDWDDDDDSDEDDNDCPVCSDPMDVTDTMTFIEKLNAD